MTSLKRISTVLPVYNGSKYLEASIQSVLNQTFSNFELIIIDDCSTDSSGEICQKYAALDPRITCYRNDNNLKLPASLNKGFSKANGDYLTWTSCDNLYLPRAFEKMVQALESHEKWGLVYASMQLIDGKDEDIGFIQAGPPNNLIYRNVVGACFLYKKAVAHQIGGYDTNLFLCEDYEYWLRIASVSSIQSISETLYQYRKHSGSLSHKHEKEIIDKGIRIQKKYYSSFVKTRSQAGLFYAHLRARDIYNRFRQLYLFIVLLYSPSIFLREVCKLLLRHK